MSGACPDCEPGKIFNCRCFRDTGNTEGAVTISRLYELESNGQLDTSTTNGIIANIISYGYTTASVQCQQSFVNQQTQEIDCTNKIIGDIVRTQNPNCNECKLLAKQVYDSRQQLELDAQKRNPNYIPQVLDPEIKAAYFGLEPDGSDGVCRYVCLQCVAENVSQNIQMRITADCAVDTEEFINAFVSGMSLQAENELTKHQAALQSTGLAIQNQNDIKTLSIQIADTIRQMTLIKQLNGLNQDALNIQQIKVNQGSTSVAIQNAKQAISVSMFASLVSKTYSDTNIKASIDFDTNRKVVQIETSFNDLVNSLETTVKTMEGLLINTVGQIMITLVALLLIIMMIFAAFLYFKPSFLFGGVLGSNDTGEDDNGEETND
jgi:hypothetical protein